MTGPRARSVRAASPAQQWIPAGVLVGAVVAGGLAYATPLGAVAALVGAGLASASHAMWQLIACRALMGAGAAVGIRPFGVEAQRVLRLEKGHIIIGQDTDGLTHPHEADMAWAIAAKKAYFMGGRSIAIQMARPLTRKLVGFTVEDAGAPVPEECHLTIRGSEIVGRVTSAVRSPALGLFLDLEIRLLHGPVFVDQDYTIAREIVGLSQSRRTESYWTRTTLTDVSTGQATAEVLLHSGVFKESYPGYPKHRLA